MGATEKFCLKWNDFESNISHSFRELREDKDFFDLTLACDDENHVSAHKVILSACSPFFRSILRRLKHDHPMLYLKGIKHSDLTAVLNFMYHGEVNVAQEDLNSFLAVAEELKVKGLTQQQKQDSDDQNESTSVPSPKSVLTTPKSAVKSKSRDSSSLSGGDSSITHPPPAKKARAHTPSSQHLKYSTENDSDEIQEIIPVKSELNLMSSVHTEPHTPSHSSLPITPRTETRDNHVVVAGGAVEDYSDTAQDFRSGYEEYGEGGFEDEGGFEQSGNMDNSSVNVDANKDVEEYMQCLTENGVESWQCLICYKVDKRKSRLKDHIEGIHQMKRNICKYCEKTYSTKNSLQKHISTHHKNQRGVAEILINDFSYAENYSFC